MPLYSVPWVIWRTCCGGWASCEVLGRTTMTHLCHTGKLTSSGVRLRKHHNLLYSNYNKAFVGRKWNRSHVTTQAVRGSNIHTLCGALLSLCKGQSGVEGHTSPVAWEDHPRPESQEEHQAHTRSTQGSEKSKSNRAAPCVQSQNDWRYQAHGHFAGVNQITRPSLDKDYVYS